MKRKALVLLFNCWLMQSFGQNCTRVVDSETFSSSQSFLFVGAGDVTVYNGKGVWLDAACGAYDRAYRVLNDTLSDNYFRAEVSFQVLPNASGYGGGANLIAFTSGVLDFLSYDASLNYALTDQDGLGVVVSCVNVYDNNIDNWALYFNEKDGDQRYSGANTIALSAAISNYYLVLERTSPVLATMSLYTDSTQTTLLGQAQNPIHPTVEDLFVFQFGVNTFGSFSRHFNGSIDNLIICDDMVTGVSEIGAPEGITLSNNIIDNSGFSILSNYFGEINLFAYDMTGKKIHEQFLSPGENQIKSNWNPGMYLLHYFNGKEALGISRVIAK